jgi:predicted Zn-dependent protease
MRRLLDPPKFLSQDASLRLAQRVMGFARGGGETSIQLYTEWNGHLRWARNRVSTTGDVLNVIVSVTRDIRGASASYVVNQTDDTALQAAVQYAEWFLTTRPTYQNIPEPTYDEPYLKPKIFSEATYGLDAAARSDAAQQLMAHAEEANTLSAGYIEAKAAGFGVYRSSGFNRYYPFTTAQYSVTVRDPKGTGSGWAGVDFSDWNRIDAPRLTAVALDKCLRSVNPVAVEPGRYTAILEPQAVADLLVPLLERALDRNSVEHGYGPFAYQTMGPGGVGVSKIGQQVFDRRVTLTADVMDPDLGWVPFDFTGEPYKPATWVKDGVLVDLAYRHRYATQHLGVDSPLLNRGAIRMSGGTATIDEMVASTERGLLVTRFDDINILDGSSMLLSGYTRDGLWLVEKGKIAKPVKNFRITESPMFVLNNIEQMGTPIRVFHPSAPMVVPPLKVQDFSFSALSDAV